MKTSARNSRAGVQDDAASAGLLDDAGAGERGGAGSPRAWSIKGVRNKANALKDELSVDAMKNRAAGLQSGLMDHAAQLKVKTCVSTRTRAVGLYLRALSFRRMIIL